PYRLHEREVVDLAAAEALGSLPGIVKALGRDRPAVADRERYSGGVQCLQRGEADGASFAEVFAQLLVLDRGVAAARGAHEVGATQKVGDVNFRFDLAHSALLPCSLTALPSVGPLWVTAPRRGARTSACARPAWRACGICGFRRVVHDLAEHAGLL